MPFPDYALDVVPLHVKPTEATDDQIWQRLEFQFGELCHVIENCRLETIQEAVGEQVSSGTKSSPTTKSKKAVWKDAAPKWDDETVGQEVRAWNLIPYIDGLDRVRLMDRIAHAKRLIPHLRRHFADKALTPSFLQAWGAFCASAGTIRFVYLSEPRPGSARRANVGREDNLDQQRIWFAYNFRRARKQTTSDDLARDMVQRLINVVVRKQLSGITDQDVEWFKRFLTPSGKGASAEASKDPKDDRPLTGEFRRRLSKARMKSLLNQSSDDLPPLDWEFPPLRGRGD